MASKLDQSLDAIIGDGPARRGRAGRRPRTRAAPVGGVKKAVATAKSTAAKAAAKLTGKNTKPETNAPTTGATKVIVSNLPLDVSEAQIKEYFQQVAGPVRRVWLTYGPNGTSRGIATLQFANVVGATKAMEQRGTKVDGRAIRVEAIVNEAASGTTKTLRERATNAPNAQPKKVTAEPVKGGRGDKKATVGGRGATAARGRGGRAARGGRTAGRPKKKTAEELDAEMTDYFGAGGEPAAAGATAAAPAQAGTGVVAPANATGGDDMGMDEIS